jgi:hypothetical protein
MPPLFLLAFPPEILHHIVISAISASPIGPPTVLLSLLLTCQALYVSLSPQNYPSLYVDLFVTQFDSGALVRRLGHLPPEHTRFEWSRRLIALKCLRRGHSDDPELLDALLIAFFMLLENDGQNLAQLQWAGLSSFVHRYVRDKVLDGPGIHNGWPLNNEINTLVVFIAWVTSSRGESSLSSLFPFSSSCQLL